MLKGSEKLHEFQINTVIHKSKSKSYIKNNNFGISSNSSKQGSTSFQKIENKSLNSQDLSTKMRTKLLMLRLLIIIILLNQLKKVKFVDTKVIILINVIRVIIII